MVRREIVLAAGAISLRTLLADGKKSFGTGKIRLNS
jgi:hypothetical protein